jgi:hypothetical protein
VKGIDLTAFGADRLIAVAGAEQVIQAGVIGRKLCLKLFDIHWLGHGTAPYGQKIGIPMAYVKGIYA